MTPLLRRASVQAFLILTLVAAALAVPALVGRAALGPDAALDGDALFRIADAPPAPRPINDQTPILLDLPRDTRIARGLRAGRLDTWNPLLGCGAPLWAEQAGPFFPLKLPFYLHPTPFTYDLFKLLRLACAGFGAYLLARRRGLSHTPSLGAGILFELCGVMVGETPFAVASPSYVLPWVLLGAEGLARGPSRASLALAGVALGVAGNGGHPTITLAVLLAFAVSVAAHAFAAARRGAPAAPGAARGLWGALGPGRALLLAGVAAGLIGLALAAPFLLPLIELQGAAVFYKASAFGEQVWQRDLAAYRAAVPTALFVPNYLLSLRDDPQDGALFPFGFACAVGLVALPLLLLGLGRRRLGPGLTAVLGLGVVLSLVPPGFGWVHHLPGVRFMLPQYAFPLVLLPLTQAFGDGVAAPARLRRAVALAGLAAAGLYLASPDERLAFAQVARRALASGEGRLRLLLPPACAALVLGMAARLVRRRREPWAQRLLVVAATIEGLVTMADYLQDRRSAVLHSAPSGAVRFLQGELGAGQARMIGVPYTVGTPQGPLYFDLPDMRSLGPLPVRRFKRFKDLIDPAAFYPTFQTVEVAISPLLDLAAVRYVVTARKDAGPPLATLRGDPQLALAYADRFTAIYRNDAALPRARVVHQLIFTVDEEDSLRCLKDAASRGPHAREAGLADRACVEAPAGALPVASPPPGARDTVRLAPARDPQVVEVEVDLAAAGVLVVADTYYPGWVALVDGERAPLVPADLLFRGVPVPAGRHRVTLVYRPVPLYLGVGCALAGATIILALVLGARRRRVALVGASAT